MEMPTHPNSRTRFRGRSCPGSSCIGPPVAPGPADCRSGLRSILIGDCERRFYRLCAWVVMPNHVHLLKGSTARNANRILGRTGQPFWQDESFDRYLRRSSQIERTIDYIENNPVSARLVYSPDGWP